MIFEACAEDWKVKVDIHSRIADALRKIKDKNDRIICTGTCGLSITGLAELYPEEQRNPKVFELMHERSEAYFGRAISYSQMVYVGDNVKKDFLAHEELGMRSVWFRDLDGLYSY